MFKGYHNSINSPLYRGFPNLTFGGNTGTAYNFNRCLLWLDAAYGTSTVVNGANVSSWSDRINGVLYTQATAVNQPTYVLSDANFNNLPTLNFGTTSGNRLLLGSSSFPLGNSTIALVVRVANNIVAQGNYILTDGGANIGFAGGGTTAGYSGFGYYQSSNLYTRTNVEDTLMHIVVANKNFIIVDGVNQTSAVANFGMTFTSIGNSNGNLPMLSIIGEILLYDYLMSETDAIALSNNINVKYQKY